MALSAAQITAVSNGVSNASRNSIKDILFANKSVLGSGDWLNAHNKYVVNTIERIKTDGASSKIVSKYLSDYIAISSILHCKDAWDYFSSSISAVMEGNIYNAIHLAYYAELRATTSFLASEGVGVFNSHNYFVNSFGKCVKFSGKGIPTHSFVWPAINEWAKIGANRNTLLEIIKVNGYSINDWLRGADMLYGSPLTTSLASDWLSKWSLDLAVLSEDHNVRNIVSYNPQDIKKILRYSTNSKKELQFIIAKWNLAEPSSSEKFRNLDYRLLREALHKFYETKYPIGSTRPSLKSFIREIFTKIGAPSNPTLEAFLASKAQLNNIVFNEIVKPALGKREIINPFSIIARAFMLLRISTASVEDLLNYAGYNKTLLEFWWKDILTKKAIWDVSSPPAVMNELWDEVAISISNLNAILAPGTTISPLLLKQSNAEDLITLKQFQRAHLWGIGI